jgi:small subunit ribosomal protein S6e
MVEFKLVVSDPEASEKILKVKAVADDSLPFEKEHSEGRQLAVAKISKKLFEELSLNQAVIGLRFSQESGKKIVFHLRPQLDESVEENVVRVPADLLTEKIGELEAECEAFRSKAWQLTLDDEKSRLFIGKRIKESVDASIIGLKGKLVITGGTDSSGFPMRPDLPGPAKKKVLLSGPPGYRPKRRGERRRKTIRGDTITDDIVQINTVLKREAE